MKALVEVVPTPEQLALFSRTRPGVEVIRGAAGSGKTTTALLKLRAAVGFYVNRARRTSARAPVKVLVLTFNRTLRGYVKALAEQQFAQGSGIELEVSTFSSWSRALLGNPSMLEDEDARKFIEAHGAAAGFAPDFAVDEALYVLGRFLPTALNDYLSARRDGRGSTPRMDRAARENLLQNVIAPYQRAKADANVQDWNDLAVNLALSALAAYDVVVVDEAQDFSGNEIRAVMNQLSDAHTVTLVLDTTQRIYSRSGFTWQELGLTVRPENSYMLSANYRNTQQIARFAAGILSGLNPDEDGALPNFKSAVRVGPLPVVLEGRFTGQIDFAVQYLGTINLAEDSVAFLHPKGGGWFDATRSALRSAGLPFVELSRRAEWPEGVENIALCTMHSAKGLEFDHVVILGLNREVMQVRDTEDAEYEPLVRSRRLLAMAVGRARKSVLIGYRPDDAPVVAEFFVPGTYERASV